MDHPRHFEKFIENISLDATRKGRIDAAINNLRSFAEDDILAKLSTGAVYFQGSYSYGTVTRPLVDATEYDVDVVLPLDANRRPDGRRDPDAILDYVKSRLDTYQDYAGKVTRRRVCVRINYAGDFHLDLVPAHQPGGPGAGLLVPNRESGKWEASFPEQYTAWVRASNGGRAQFRFSSTVKMLKRWRDVAFGLGRGPSSIVLTTLAGYNNPGWLDPSKMPFASAYAAAPSTASFLFDTVNLMNKKFEDFHAGTKIHNPANPQEDLAARWGEDGFQLFRKKLDTFANRVSSAYLQDDRERSIRWWQDAFPEGFPTRP